MPLMNVWVCSWLAGYSACLSVCLFDLRAEGIEEMYLEDL